MKKNYQFLIHCFFFFLLSNISFGQDNYKFGNIETISGTITEGYIEYKNWDRTPEFILFKTNLEQKAKKYKPTELKQFKVADDIYKSATVQIERSPRHLENMSRSKELRFKTKIVFLQSLIGGTKSLYLYKDKEGNEHFYIYQNNSFDLLVYKQYFDYKKTTDVKNKKKKVVREYKEYLEQLNAYMSDCPHIKQEIVNASYEKESLTKLFRQYYECTDLSLTYEKKARSEGREFGVLLGLNSTKLVFNGESSVAGFSVVDYLNDANFTPSLNISVGGFISLTPSRGLSLWSWDNELMYQYYNAKGNSVIEENSVKTVYTDYELGFSYLKVNSLVRYTLPFKMKNTSFHIRGGMSGGFMISEKNNTQQQRINFSNTGNEYEENKIAFTDLRTYEVGFLVGGIIRYKNLIFELRGEIGDGISQVKLLTSRTFKGSLVVGIAF